MENSRFTIPYPRYSDGRLDTIYLRDTFPCLKDFRDSQILSLVSLKAQRNRGRFREFPKLADVWFDWTDRRGAYEGPLDEEAQLTLFGKVVFRPIGG